MEEGFSGEPLTRWDGNRNMILEEDFYYTDSDGFTWHAPKGSCLNGATIPRAFWNIIGPPYAGKYRRASVVHDVGVGELCNPNVSIEQRKKADKMFYYACRHDGCSKHFASMLYIGVRFGTWASTLSTKRSSPFDEDFEEIRDIAEFGETRDKFWKILDESKTAIENEDLDLLDEIIKKNLPK